VGGWFGGWVRGRIHVYLYGVSPVLPQVMCVCAWGWGGGRGGGE